MKEILPLKSKIVSSPLQHAKVSNILLKILFSLFMFCIELSSLSIHSMFCIPSWILDLLFHRFWNPTEKTMWSDCWPRHGQLGVLRGSQTGTMMIFCGFREWIVADIETLHQIPFQGMTCPRSGGDGLQLSASLGTAWAPRAVSSELTSFPGAHIHWLIVEEE